MSRKMYWLFAGILALSMILAACGGGGDAGTGGGDTVTITIGFTKSVTGKYETSSGRQFNGFELWLADVNNAGGIALSDGTVVTFDTVRVQAFEVKVPSLHEIFVDLVGKSDAEAA